MLRQGAEVIIRGQVLSLDKDSTKVIELKYGANSGKPYAKLRVRTQSGKYESQADNAKWIVTDESYFDVTIFGADAEKAADGSLKLFDGVFIQGNIRTQHWDKTDAEGKVVMNTATGKAVQKYRQEITANTFAKVEDSNFKPKEEAASHSEAAVATA